MTSDTIIVQNRNAHLINWACTLAGSATKVHLVCDLITQQRLEERGLAKLFEGIHPTFFDDKETVKATAARIIREIGSLDVAVCANHEDDIELCASIREDNNLHGPRLPDVARFRNKLLMKECLQDKPQWLPSYLRFSKSEYLSNSEAYARHVVSLLGLPIFAKPIDAAGSKGTRLLENEQDLHNWARALSDETVYELDEYLRGDMYHCDFLIYQGRIIDRRVARFLMLIQTKSLCALRNGALEGVHNCSCIDADAVVFLIETLL